MLATTTPGSASTARVVPAELKFRVQGGMHDGRIVRIRAAKCSIGSAAGCTLRLRAADIEPLHCLILSGRNGTIVRRNSPRTYLNGGPFTDAVLSAGDILRIGSVELVVVACSSGVGGLKAARSSPGFGICLPQPAEASVEASLLQLEQQRLTAELASLNAELQAARDRVQRAERAKAEAEADTERIRRENVHREQSARELENNLSRERTEQSDTSAREQQLQAELAKALQAKQEFENRLAEKEAIFLQQLEDRVQLSERARAEAEAERIRQANELREQSARELESILSRQQTGQADTLAREQQLQGELTRALQSKQEFENRLAEREAAFQQQFESKCQDALALQDALASQQAQREQEQAAQASHRQQLEAQLVEMETEFLRRKYQAQEEFTAIRERLDDAVSKLKRQLQERESELAAQRRGGSGSLTISLDDLRSDKERLDEEQHIVRLEKQAAEMTVRLAEREQQLADRNGELAQRNAELANCNGQLAEHDAELVRRDSALAQRDTELANCNSRLAERDAELAQRDTELENCISQLAERDAALAQRDVELANCNSRLAERDAVLAQSKTELANSISQLADRNAELVQRESELGEIRARNIELSAASQLARQLEGNLASSESAQKIERESWRNERAELEDRLQELETARCDAENRLNSTTERNVEKQAELISRCADFERMCEQLQAQCTNLQTQRSALEIRLSEVEGSLEQTLAQVDAGKAGAEAAREMEQLIEQWQSETHTWQMRMEEASEALSSAKQRCSTLEAEAAELREVNRAACEAKVQDQNFDALSNELNAHQEELTAARARHEQERDLFERRVAEFSAREERLADNETDLGQRQAAWEADRNQQSAALEERSQLISSQIAQFEAEQAAFARQQATIIQQMSSLEDRVQELTSASVTSSSFDISRLDDPALSGELETAQRDQATAMIREEEVQEAADLEPHPATPASQSQLPAHEDDDSIAQYMSRLLGRVRSSDPPGATNSKAERQSPARPVRVEAQQESASPEKSEEPKEYTPRQAPEHPERMSLMRELANSAAKSAIHTHARQHQKRETKTKSLVALLSLGGAAGLFVVAGFTGSWLAMAGSVIFSALFCVTSVRAIVGGFKQMRLAPQPEIGDRKEPVEPSQDSSKKNA